MSKKPIAVIALIIMVAAAIFGWLHFHPQNRQLRLTIVEQGIPATALRSARVGYEPGGQLHVEDNLMEATDGRGARKERSTWEVLDMRFRATPQQEWRAVPPPPGLKAASWPVVLPWSGDLPYKMVNGLADKAGEWQVVLRNTRTYRDNGGTCQGSAEHTLTQVLREDTQKPAFRPLVPGKAYVASIQWKEGNSWREIPQAGQAEFPLMLSSEGFMDLRAVNKNPKEPWPGATGEGDSWPRWSGDGIEPRSPGDALMMLDNPNLIARHARDYKTVSAICGNTVQRQILFLPKPDIFVREPIPAFSKTLRKKTKTLKFNVEADVKWEGGWHPPIKVRFSAREIRRRSERSAARTIVQINGSAIQDDTVTLPSGGGTAKVTLAVPESAGIVEVKAWLVTPGNNSWFHSTRFSASKFKAAKPKNTG